MPPTSPAETRLTKRSSNTFGCFPSASAKVDPLSTSSFTLRITFLNEAFSCCMPRMSRHWTSGSPASIIVANCLVNTASSFFDTFPLCQGNAMRRSRGLAFTLTGTICCRRSWAMTNASFGASTSPVIVPPTLVFPSHMNFAIFSSALRS
jgi:hypothetical protein